MNTKEYCIIYNGLVDDVLAEQPETIDDAVEMLHQFVDGSQWVIYYSEAWELVKYLKDYEPLMLEEYESLAADAGFEHFETLNAYCTAMAYWALIEPAGRLLEAEFEEAA